MRKKIILPIFLFFCLVISVAGQGIKEKVKYGDPSFYIIDSLDLSILNTESKSKLDSFLTSYKRENRFIHKIEIINKLIVEINNSYVAESYNDWAEKQLLQNKVLDSYYNFTLAKVYLFRAKNSVNDSAFVYIQKIQALIHNIKKRNKVAYLYNELGLIKKKNGLYSQAVSFYKKGIDKLKKSDDLKLKAELYNNIGVSYRHLNKIPKALTYYLKNIYLKEQFGDSIGLCIAHNNIGLVYVEINEYNSALDFFRKALDISQKINATKLTAVSYTNLGGLNIRMGRYSEALKYVDKSIDLYKQIQDERSEAMILNMKGKLFQKQKQTLEAIKYYNEGLTLAQKNNQNHLRITFLLNKAKAHEELKNYRLASKEALSSLTLAEEYNDLKTILKSSKVLTRIAEKNKNFELAYNMLRLQLQTEDSLNREENFENTYRLKTQYEYEKKKATDSIKNAVADKIKLAKLREVELENEKNSLEVEAQRRQKLYLYLGLFLVIIFSGVIFNRFRASQKQKAIIQKQKEATESQKEHIEKQHKELEETHREISDSIKYSERLQKAIFPSEKDLKSYLRDHFILFQPKDTVSGDFYWLQKVEKYTFFAVGDCTGHGVPGAMVSVVCSNALNRSIKEFDLTNTGEILNKTRELVIETFSQSGKDVRDGMDIALCSYREGDNFIMYSGANNPLWIIRKTKYLTEYQKSERSTVMGNEFSLIEYKANKQPIGLYENMGAFNQTRIDLFKNDTLYLFTDGFADQFGGEKGKKFKYKPFKKMLLSGNQLEMKKQREKIFDSYINWKGNMEQVDDICIVGIKI